jgi:hypothetical protein
MTNCMQAATLGKRRRDIDALDALDALCSA